MYITLFLLVLLVLFLAYICLWLWVANNDKKEENKKFKEKIEESNQEYAELSKTHDELISAITAEGFKRRWDEDTIEILTKENEKYKRLYLEEIERNIKLTERIKQK